MSREQKRVTVKAPRYIANLKPVIDVSVLALSGSFDLLTVETVQENDARLQVTGLYLESVRAYEKGC